VWVRESTRTLTISVFFIGTDPPLSRLNQYRAGR
jgi:hypothetical protein